MARLLKECVRFIFETGRFGVECLLLRIARVQLARAERLQKHRNNIWF